MNSKIDMSKRGIAKQIVHDVRLFKECINLAISYILL